MMLIRIEFMWMCCGVSLVVSDFMRFSMLVCVDDVVIMCGFGCSVSSEFM